MKKVLTDRILVVAMPLLGDVLLATPLMRSLRRAYPEAVIDALVYRGHEAILEGNPDINSVITVAERPRGRAYLALVRRLFRRYDLSISNSTSDRKILYAIFAAPKRISIVPSARWQNAWKRTMTYAWTELDDESTHTVVQNLRLADLLGLERCYQVVVPQAKDAFKVLDEMVPFEWREQAFAVLHLAPRWRYKRWTVSGWTELAEHLVGVGLRIVITGGHGKREREYIRSVTANMPQAVLNLAGKLRFGEVSGLISTCKLYVGPDTAVTHIAAATGVPTVALFGPTNPLKWAPWPYEYASDKSPFAKVGTRRVNNVLLVQGQGACVPCHEEGCDRHKMSRSRCLEQLPSRNVIRAVHGLLDSSTRSFVAHESRIEPQETADKPPSHYFL